jgi:hypothetical protein
MKPLLIIFLLTLLSIGCLKKISKRETEDHLKASMLSFLDSSISKKTNANFTVLEVIYFPEKTAYDCEFKVRMKTPEKDTVGIMKAIISNDFKVVKRRY